MNKKAQGLSLNTIIIAALVIMVLIILGLVFMGRMGSFGQKQESCQAKGGTCRTECAEGEMEMAGILGGICPEDYSCCMPEMI